ncbi:hypothetical protein [Nostoc sp.]
MSTTGVAEALPHLSSPLYPVYEVRCRVARRRHRYNKTSITEVKLTMSITLDLPPKVEALLRQRAESTGQDISQMALAVLTLGLSLDDQDFFEALKGIQRGLDDFEQGQFSSLEDFIAEQNQKYGLSLEA